MKAGNAVATLSHHSIHAFTPSSIVCGLVTSAKTAGNYLITARVAHRTMNVLLTDLLANATPVIIDESRVINGLPSSSRDTPLKHVLSLLCLHAHLLLLVLDNHFVAPPLLQPAEDVTDAHGVYYFEEVGNEED